MKKQIIIAAMLAFAVGVFAQNTPQPTTAPATTAPTVENKPAEPKAGFKWVETIHDFGKITQGKPVTNEFKFTNTGKAPLILTNVRGSCGCTTTDYTKEPIAPGKTGFIKATYNAANMGSFNKSVTVTANTETGSEVLYIKGEVAADPAAPATPKGPN